MKIIIPLHLISRKKTPNDAVTPQRQSQFTPKMKANAVSRLLSSLVWIDQYNESNGMTNFMEFIRSVGQWILSVCLWVVNMSIYCCQLFSQPVGQSVKRPADKCLKPSVRYCIPEMLDIWSVEDWTSGSWLTLYCLIDYSSLVPTFVHILIWDSIHTGPVDWHAKFDG